MALDFTLLTRDQIWGEKALEVIKKYGSKVAPTDLSVLLGGRMGGYTSGEKTSEGELGCDTWTASFHRGFRSKLKVCACNADGLASERFEFVQRNLAVRPVLPPSETAKLTPTVRRKGINGVDIVEFGEYPQTIMDEKTGKELDELHASGALSPTGKTYTFDDIDPKNYTEKFRSWGGCKEYAHNGKKYIRLDGHPADNDSQLSSGEKAQTKPYWIQVKPIEWLQDKDGTWVSKKCLFSGVQFDTEGPYNLDVFEDFEKTFMKRYLKTYFSKEIVPSHLKEKSQEVEKTTSQKLTDLLSSKSKTLEKEKSPLATQLKAQKQKSL